jgi:hypothetical protein
MAKIGLDKYYTPTNLAKYIVNKTKEIIGEQNITEYVEPSAGAGVFLDFLDKPYFAYDIEPEDSRVVEQDYLELELEYKRGRCVIGNPPFGRGNTLSVKFYKKSIELADYIAFIQPISQLNNNMQMYEFDLIHSEDLGMQTYTDRELHCCFNIYKRPANELNKKPNYKLKDITILEWRRGANYKIPKKYDYAICGWGAAIGKQIKQQGQFALEYYIIINNDKYKKQIINVLANADWKDIFKGISTPRLPQWRIFKALKEQIPELK